MHLTLAFQKSIEKRGSPGWMLHKLTSKLVFACPNSQWFPHFLVFQSPIGLASADVTAERDAWKRIATGKTGSKQMIASHTNACWETGRSLVKVLSSLTRRFKKFWQLFDSLLPLNWTKNGGWASMCGVWGCFRSCRRRSTGADIRPRTRLHGNHSTSKYDELVFVSLFRAFSLSSDPLERAIKSPSHKEQPKETSWLASTGLLQGSNARVQHWAIRLDERRGTEA